MKPLKQGSRIKDQGSRSHCSVALCSLFIALRNRRGIALVEAMVALSILTVVFSGILSLVNYSISLSRSISDRYVGSYLAAEGIELVKSLIDANKLQGRDWMQGILITTSTLPVRSIGLDYRIRLSGGVNTCNQGPIRWVCTYDFSNGGRYTVLATSTGLYTYNNNGPAPAYNGSTVKFRRWMDVQRLDPNEVRVISRVRWTTAGGIPSSIDVYDHFFDWRP